MERSLVKSIILQDSIHRDADGNLVVPVRAVPFSVEGEITDPIGDWFHKSTNFGDQFQFDEMYFDHDDVDWMPEEVRSEFKNKSIGWSYLTHKDDTGLFANLVIDRRTKYLDQMEWLFKNGYLEASSVASHRDPNVIKEGNKKKGGRLDEWFLKRIDPTPTNADGRANVMKSLGDLLMPTGTEKEEKKEEKKSGSVLDQIKNVFKEAGIPVDLEEKKDEKEPEKPAAEAEKTETAPVPVMSAEQFAEVKSGMAAILAQVLEVKNAAAEIAEIKKSLGEVIGGVNDVQIALPEMAKLVASNIFSRTKEELKKSAAELEAEKILDQAYETQKKSGITPGGKSDKQFGNFPGMGRKM